MVLNLLLRSLFSDIDNSFDIDSYSENVYNYIYSLLVDANIKKDTEILNKALDEIRGMRDTWKEVMNQTRSMNK